MSVKDKLCLALDVDSIEQVKALMDQVGDSVGLHPMTVIFSMLFWSLLLGGFIGALLAVPMTAAIKVLFMRYIWDRSMQEENNTPIINQGETEST